MIKRPRAIKNRLDEVFANREPLAELSFYEKDFQSRDVPAEVVIKVRRILEDEFGFDLSRLSADDDFAQNLSFLTDYGSLDAVEVVMRLEEEFGIEISDGEAE